MRQAAVCLAEQRRRPVGACLDSRQRRRRDNRDRVKRVAVVCLGQAPKHKVQGRARGAYLASQRL